MSALATPSFLHELNEEQRDVVLHGDGPCLVIAGAGSGKTRTLVYRVAYLLEQGIDPSRILLLTFTNKAAGEMRERVARLTGNRASQTHGGTFHSIANRLLRSWSTHLGYPASFSILDSEDSRAMLKAVIKDQLSTDAAKSLPSPAILQDIISFARNTQATLPLVLEQRYASPQTWEEDLHTIAAMYQTRKRDARVMDFDDLLTNLTHILDDPNIGSELSHAFDYVLVDEYQDTNKLQERIVHGFAHEHQNIFAVGDDAQSIYAFRGANIANMLDFPTRWSSARLFHLTSNYRSTPEILEIANASLLHNQAQFQKTLHATHAHGTKPCVIACTSAIQEAVMVAEALTKRHASGVAWNCLAVLFRSSSHSQALEFELTKRGIVYEYRGGLRFFDRAHVKDVLAFLRLAINPHDEIAWLRVLALQPGIGATGAALMATHARKAESLQDALEATGYGVITARHQTGWNACSLILRRLMEVRTPSAMIRAITSSTYRDVLSQEYADWQERLDDLEQLARFADMANDLTTFLSEIALYDDATTRREDTTAKEPRLVLSTIHQAKGLEWNTVFLIHVADQHFPNRRAVENGEIEEERRLFYVAVTRAERELFISYPLTVGYDALTLGSESLFVSELPPDCYERIEFRQPASPYASGLPRRVPTWRTRGWDNEEPAIEIDAHGERHMPLSKTVWKQKPSAALPSSTSPKTYL